MAEIKFGFWMLQATGYAAFVWAFIVPWGDVKATILFIAAMIFATYKICNAHIDFRKKQVEFEDFKKEQKKKWDLYKMEVDQKIKDAKNDK